MTNSKAMRREVGERDIFLLGLERRGRERAGERELERERERRERERGRNEKEKGSRESRVI